MNPEEPSPQPLPRPPSPGGMEGLDPAELLARALHTVQPSAGHTAWVPPAPEELARLLPQYGIESLLGHGGMGAVYKGRQPDLDRPVAIKLLPAEIAADEEFIARFRREARTLAKLQHSGIVSVYDFGQTSAGHLFFVMEFVEGTDPQKILRGPGLEPAQALNLISQVCDALHYAHSKDVVHRDIKPGNILLSTEGYVKLADFGLARPIKEGSTVLTGGNVMMGTADYMAPEQRDGHADQRADIYALGVMLYEMLTGKRPHGVFDPPSRRVQVDIRLDSVVLKAMQQEPERRYQQVSEMKTDVDKIRTTPPPRSDAETEPYPASPPIRPVARPRRPMAAPNPARARTPDPGSPSPATILKTTNSSNHTMLILGIVALLMLGTLALFLATRKNGDTYNTVQNLTYQEIQNNYFTNLITTGVTTAKDLEAITDIRPFGSLFIGVSKESITLQQAQELSKRTGAEMLRIEDSNSGSSKKLTDWIRTTYASQLAATAWVQQIGEPRIVNSQRVLPQPNDEQPRKVFLQWQGPDSLLSFANKSQKVPQPDSGKAGRTLTEPQDTWPSISIVPKDGAGRLVAVALTEGAEVSDSGIGAIPPEMATMSNIVRISVAGRHALALTGDGRVYRWGYEGQVLPPLPKEMTGRTKKVVQILAGHPDAVLLEDGNVLLNEGSGARRIPSAFPFRKIAGTAPYLYGFDRQDRITYIGPREEVAKMNVPEEVKGIAIRELKGARTKAMALAMNGDVFIWGNDETGKCKMRADIESSLASDPVSLINMDSNGRVYLIIQKSGKVNFWGPDKQWFPTVIGEAKNAVNSWQFLGEGYWIAFMIERRQGDLVEYEFIEQDASHKSYLRKLLKRHTPFAIASNSRVSSTNAKEAVMLMITPP